MIHNYDCAVIQIKRICVFFLHILRGFHFFDNRINAFK